MEIALVAATGVFAVFNGANDALADATVNPTL